MKRNLFCFIMVVVFFMGAVGISYSQDILECCPTSEVTGAWVTSDIDRTCTYAYYSLTVGEVEINLDNPYYLSIFEISIVLTWYYPDENNIFHQPLTNTEDENTHCGIGNKPNDEECAQQQTVWYTKTANAPYIEIKWTGMEDLIFENGVAHAETIAGPGAGYDSWSITRYKPSDCTER